MELKKSIRSTQLIEQNALGKDKFTRTVNEEMKVHEDLDINQNNQNHSCLTAKVVEVNAHDKRSQLKNRFISNPYNYSYRFIKKTSQQFNSLDSNGADTLHTNKHDDQKHKFEQGNKKNAGISVKIRKPAAKLNTTSRWKTKPLGSRK